MSRIGLTPDEMLLTWSAASVRRYAAHVPGLDVLEGETIALIGSGTTALADLLADSLHDIARIDGAAAAAAGALRIEAVQAYRSGARALIVSDPFAGLSEAARSVAVADLAGLAQLGLTTIVATSDPLLAALFADRVAVVADGHVVVAYPVLANAPRTPDDVAGVTERLHRRLAPA